MIIIVIVIVINSGSDSVIVIMIVIVINSDSDSDSEMFGTWTAVDASSYVTVVSERGVESAVNVDDRSWPHHERLLLSSIILHPQRHLERQSRELDVARASAREGCTWTRRVAT